MDFVVMVAGGPEPVLDPGIVNSVHAACQGSTLHWLDPERAVEFAVANLDSATLTHTRNLVDRHAIDLFIVPAHGRRKAMLIADMDSTIIQQECIDELAAAVGTRTEVAAITHRTMNGEIAFADATRLRVKRLAGLDLGIITELLTERIVLTPGAAELVGTMRQHDAWCVLVSGGYTVFSEPIGARLGFHENHANRLVIRDGKLTGNVEMPLLDGPGKHAIMTRVLAERELSDHQVLAVGDGANDLPMLKAAGLGVAFRAKPVVRQQCRHHVRHSDLRALLYLQGFESHSFVSWDPH